MCIKNAIQLSLDGDTFSALKKDFDAVLLRTVGNMESKSADEATITLKLTISLEKEHTNFGEEPKQITRPTFKHDISSVMQVKDKVSGTLKEDYELVFDDDEGKYVMRRISNGQMTIFETVEEQEEDAVEYVNAPAVLPAPSEPAVIEATAEEVVEDIDEEDEPNETAPGPFEWLKQFVGSQMHVTENMGNFAVRTDGNKIVLTSSTTPDSPFFCPAEKLEPHVGHKLVCVGYYTRQNNEICLIGVKRNGGRIKPCVKNICCSILEQPREHSRKPDIVREYIERIAGDVPKIELFARQSVDGWDCWGNEV